LACATPSTAMTHIAIQESLNGKGRGLDGTRDRAAIPQVEAASFNSLHNKPRCGPVRPGNSLYKSNAVLSDPPSNYPSATRSFFAHAASAKNLHGEVQ
jgi:hypothetical protein